MKTSEITTKLDHNYKYDYGFELPTIGQIWAQIRKEWKNDKERDNSKTK